MSVTQPASNELALIDLLMNMDLADEHPESFYHQFLETAIRLIPESRFGTVSLISGDEWKYVAAVGHQLDLLLNLPLQASWDLSSGEIMEIESLEEKHHHQFPDDVAQVFQQAVRKTAASLMGAYQLPGGDRVTLSVDIPFGSPARFSADSKRIFQALLKLAGKHQRLVKDEKELRSAYNQLQDRTNGIELSYQEISKLSDKLRHLLTLAKDLGEGVVEAGSFFEKLLESALTTVDITENGTLSLVEEGRWRFLCATGHDVEALQSLQLSGKWLPALSETVEVRNLMVDFQNSMPAEFFLKIKDAWKPTGDSLAARIEIKEGMVVFVTLDIAEDHEQKLPRSSILIFESFARLALSYLKLRVHTDNIKKAYLGFAEKLALLAESHDADTAQHNKRVAALSGYLAREAGLEDRLVAEIETFSILHDIGKVFLDASLINQANALEPADYEIIKTHTTLSESLLNDPFFNTARKIAMHHHERWDGSGYPQHLKGDEIPVEAQIVSLADVYDAIRSKRSYKDAVPAPEVLRILKEGDDRIKPGMFNPRHLTLLENRIFEIERLFYSDLDF